MRNLAFFSSFVLVLGASTPLSASEQPLTMVERLALRLGRQCTAEVSLAYRLQVPKAARGRQKLEECRLMWHILATKVDYHGPKLFELVPAYSAAWKRRDKRDWIFHLLSLDAAPAGWPQNLRWDVYAPSWGQILAAARAFIRKPGRHPCPRATQFGGRCDDADHACDEVPVCWQRQWCRRPTEWWSQAYWAARSCPAVIPAQEASGATLARSTRGSPWQRP